MILKVTFTVPNSRKAHRVLNVYFITPNGTHLLSLSPLVVRVNSKTGRNH